MKTTIIIFLSLFILGEALSQVPQKMSFQSVIRDANNQLLSNQEVGIQISILQGSIFGSAVYVETHSTTTNSNGVIALTIGEGNVTIGQFASIDWSTGPYFIRTETDINGGSNYTISGTSELLSVPYALHARTAETLTSKPKKYRLEYVKGDGQRYRGGGMHWPMVFRIFNVTDQVYVTERILVTRGLSLKSTASIGFEDAPFNNLGDKCGDGRMECYGGYYFIPPPEDGLPVRPFNLIVTVTLSNSTTKEVYDRYIISQFIE